MDSAGREPRVPERELDGVADEFARVRPRLFGIAYRMLGSVVDAEDIVQDVWVKWQAHDRTSVRDATAFLVTMTTRLAIEATQTARARLWCSRSVSPQGGDGLPERAVTAPSTVRALRPWPPPWRVRSGLAPLPSAMSRPCVLPGSCGVGRRIGRSANP